jgi:predicted DNA-binding transcriptional regulator YafY
MSQHGVIKRYSLIIKKISEAFYPNFASIKAYLAEKGFEVSKRTIQRDIVQIDNEFGLKISFDKRKNGYFISEKDKIQLEPFIKFLGIFRHAELLRDSLAKSRETLNFVKFETGENLSGIEFLEPTLEALRENRIVKMSYQTSWSGPLKDFSIHPYLLKQYLNRWYIVGCYPNKNKLYIFGLDRIKKLELTDCFFEL